MACDLDKNARRLLWEKQVGAGNQCRWSIGFAEGGLVSAEWWLRFQTAQDENRWLWLDSGIVLKHGASAILDLADIGAQETFTTTRCSVFVDFIGQQPPIPAPGGPLYSTKIVLSARVSDPIAGVDQLWWMEAFYLWPDVTRSLSFSALPRVASGHDPIYPPRGVAELTPLKFCHDCV